MKRILSAMLSAVFLSGMLVAQESGTNEQQKKDDIRHLLELTGSAKMGVLVMNQLLPSIKRATPGVPQKFWDEFMAEVNPKDMVELIIPIYARHFTDADVPELIRFYESPVGKKIVNEMPEILGECMEAGQIWGASILERLKKRLEQKGYKLQSGVPSNTAAGE